MISYKQKSATMVTGQNENGKLVPNAPIEVYCKLIHGERSNGWTIKIRDKRTLVLAPSVDASCNGSTTKKNYYVFERVFHKQTSLKKVFDRVALPLVQDTLLGKNGLIFVNGALSERNQVMLGTLEDIGILFRITDVIFNSINYYHATKFFFKPNGFNNFKVQSLPEALLEQQKKLSIFNRKPKYVMNVGQEWKNRILDSRTVDELDYDAKFAVFVSYLEICDHSIYDLLEDFDSGMRTNAKSKLLVEDSLCNPYVHDINKLEVRSSDEVMQLFFHGQHKITSGHGTHCKHSGNRIFTIYIVQALFDPFDSEISKNERAITVSQLSIVELGFGEMPLTPVAKNENLFSSENTSTSLAVLMKCFNAFKKSKTQGRSKVIPYHENELTYLIKSYFDGKGQMKMIICMNEGYDYEKITYLLHFAIQKKRIKHSWSSATLWSRSTSSWASKDEILFQKAISKLPEKKNLTHEQSSANGLNLVCPPSVIKSSSDDVVYLNLIDFLSKKMCCTKPLLQNLENQSTNLKNNLVTIIQENEELKDTAKVLQLNLESKTNLVIELEKKVSSIDNLKDELEKKLAALRNEVDCIKFEVKKKDLMIAEQDEQFRNVESNAKEELELERNRLKSIMEKSLFKKQKELERKICIKNKQFEMFKEIVNEKNQENNEVHDTQLAHFRQPSFATSMSVSEAKSKCSTLSSVSKFSTLMSRFCKSKNNLDSIQNVIIQSDVSLNNNSTLDFYKKNQVKTLHVSKRSPVVANVRHQKSHVGAGGLWIVHEPKKCLFSSNILKPNKKKTKSFCNLELKDILKSKASKYALQYQEQTFKGETEIYLFKADITQTIGGGVQVIFNDMEIVKQEPPPCML